MSDFLVTFLASILEEQGVVDPSGVARKAAADLRKSKMVDPLAIARAQILADPCTDYKIIMRRYHCSQGFVYKVWNSRRSVA